MDLKIAIHHYEGDFSDRWIQYCQEKNISYELVDCYRNDIIEVMKSFDILLWSWNLSHFESLQFATELIYSLEKMGKIVFPNFKTSYFYDNKIGQKYLLESIDAPIIPSYVFYTKNDALKWINTTSFPKVFKLSGGAGSMNVKLCYTKEQAMKFVNKAFGKGFSQVDRITWFTDKAKKFKEKPSKKSFKNFIKSFGRLFIPTQKEKAMSREKGYIYFQEFIPQNSFDIRIIVIGDKAIALKRLCRENDFRASGSGKIIYDKNQINKKCIEIGFQTSKKLDVQCMAYDFVFDKKNNPLIVEVSYHFSPYAYDDCQGYWDEDLSWHDAKINPQYMIIESLLEKLN
jgi:glutathione synthase/RimK-type ligase-like ATP-grasp enzyme